MRAFYNEIDPYCCAWLSNLMDAGLITPGVISDKSIVDVLPDELAGYSRVHMFAGIGVWDYALNLAGWSDDRPVWTGSCPCQPFSAAGAGLGFADERHLWPAWYHLISECRPAIVLGEQVASKDADPWVDLVHDDMEALAYAFGAVPFPSAGVGASHIRDRLYWVGDARSEGLPLRERLALVRAGWWQEGRATEQPSGASGGLADATGPGWRSERPDIDAANGNEAIRAGQAQSGRCGAACRPGPTNGFWADPDWLFCRDGKWRPVESGTFPLVDGAPARVGRLRAYGNAINAEAARVFIEEVMECLP